MKKIVFTLLTISTMLISACGPATATPTPFFWAVDELTATAGAPTSDGVVHAIAIDGSVQGMVDSTPVQGMVVDAPVQAMVTTATPIVGLVNPSVMHQGVCLYDSTNAWFLKNKSASAVTVAWKFDYQNPAKVDAEGQVTLPANSDFVKVYTSPNKGAFIIPNNIYAVSTTCFAVVAQNTPKASSDDAPAAVVQPVQSPTPCSPTAPGCRP